MSPLVSWKDIVDVCIFDSWQFNNMIRFKRCYFPHSMCCSSVSKVIMVGFCRIFFQVQVMSEQFWQTFYNHWWWLLTSLAEWFPNYQKQVSGELKSSCWSENCSTLSAPWAGNAMFRNASCKMAFVLQSWTLDSSRDECGRFTFSRVWCLNSKISWYRIVPAVIQFFLMVNRPSAYVDIKL